VCLAFGDAFHFRRVNAVHFLGVLPGLAEDPLRGGQQAGKRFVGNLAFAFVSMVI
jgi:hypothetical protein